MTKMYIKGTSLVELNGKTTRVSREISLEKICDICGLELNSLRLYIEKEDTKEAVVVTHVPDYGISIDGNVGDGERKDLYGLANVAFNNDNDKPGFYTQVFPGLYCAADDKDELCEEEGEPILAVNQQKRDANDTSRKVIYYNSDLAAPVQVSPFDEMSANTELERNKSGNGRRPNN